MTTSDSSVTRSGAIPKERRGAERRTHDGVRHLIQAFSRTASSAFNLPAGLTVFCHESPSALRVGGASAWVHDRRSHELVLTATSGTARVGEGTRIPSETGSALAMALRSDRPQPLAEEGSDGPPTSVAVPLRGRRRALGVLMLEALAPERAVDPAFLAEAEELGHQLSASIENLLLLEDVLSSRRELAHTFDSLEDLVAICDLQFKLVHANRTLTLRLNATRERIVDRPIADLIGHDAARWLEAQATAERLRTGNGDTRELDDPVLGGRFTMTISPLPGPDGKPAGAVFVARDITGQARLEAERAALRERLAQSEKLASIGQFIAGIAHELNNPLQGVLGHLELLQRQGRIPDGIRRELRVVQREADRAARIVANLLVFAGGRTAPQKMLRLNALVTHALKLRGPACRAARIDIVRRLDETNPQVAANRLLLQQALVNILVNAEQELGAVGGGRIVVSTRVLDGQQSVRLQIRDTGPGISGESMPRLFEPFYTTKEVGRGTGLGLAIAYGIVKDHRGTLAADNHPEGGAVFTIELPIVNARREARQPR